MIGIDTNVIIRYLMQDDPLLSPVAERILETELHPMRPGFLSTIVVAEIAWVLKRVYRLDRTQVASVFEQILRTESLVVEAEREVFAALTLSRDGSGSFTDALIALLAARAGCTSTLTFDRGAAEIPGFSLAR